MDDPPEAGTVIELVGTELAAMLKPFGVAAAFDCVSPTGILAVSVSTVTAAIAASSSFFLARALLPAVSIPNFCANIFIDSLFPIGRRDNIDRRLDGDFSGVARGRLKEVCVGLVVGFHN
jgi:hypothetical protein